MAILAAWHLPASRRMRPNRASLRQFALAQIPFRPEARPHLGLTRSRRPELLAHRYRLNLRAMARSWRPS
jgi:hypothetical protein